MRELADAVIRTGHSRIGVISAEQKSNDRARARVTGIQDAMAAANLPPEDLVVVETAYGIDEGAAAFLDLWRRSGRPTAVMCGNDVLAAGAINQAKEMALSVPGDVSITGFDDIELAKIVSPALTTVHVPHRRMGAEAARALVALVQDGAAPETVRIDTSLCLRESLGPPKP